MYEQVANSLTSSHQTFRMQCGLLSFYIMGDNDQQCGFGVFFSSTQAVTADRKFISEHQEGTEIHVKCQGLFLLLLSCMLVSMRS